LGALAPFGPTAYAGGGCVREAGVDETEKLVAAIFAATATLNQPTDLDAFLGHYEDCITALKARHAAAKKAENEQNIEAWTKTAR
jgi:hypothetical protein